MDIVFHAHHAPVTDSMRERAQRIVSKVASRMTRVTGAIVRFEEDGPTRKVVVELHASGRKLVVDSRGRSFDAALADAGQRLQRRAQREKNRKHSMRTRRLSTGRDDAGDNDRAMDLATA